MVAMMQTLHWHYYVCRLSYQRWAVIRKTSLRVYCAVLVPVIQRSIFSPINQWNKSCIYCWSRKTISPIGSMIAICRLLNATFSLNWEPMCTSVRATMMTVFLPTGIQDLLWIRCHHPWNPMGLPMPIHPPPSCLFQTTCFGQFEEERVNLISKSPTIIYSQVRHENPKWHHLAVVIDSCFCVFVTKFMYIISTPSSTFTTSETTDEPLQCTSDSLLAADARDKRSSL